MAEKKPIAFTNIVLLVAIVVFVILGIVGYYLK